LFPTAFFQAQYDKKIDGASLNTALHRPVPGFGEGAAGKGKRTGLERMKRGKRKEREGETWAQTPLTIMH